MSDDFGEKNWARSDHSCCDCFNGAYRALMDARAKLAVERQLKERALAALEKTQWGSCDGCGKKAYCPECHGTREDWGEPAGHRPECSVGQALSRRV